MSLEEIKRRRMEELEQQSIQANVQNQFQEQAKLQQQIMAVEALAKNFMTNEAITRYGNLKAAHPEKAIQAIAFIAQSAQSGGIKQKINDEEFKELLMRMEMPKKQFSMKRV